MTSIELVVARYAEDLSWLRRVPKAARVTVYDKGDNAEAGVPPMILLNILRARTVYDGRKTTGEPV
ncbi:MAG: hypothetical protein V1929_10535 [bacterium]